MRTAVVLLVCGVTLGGLVLACSQSPTRPSFLSPTPPSGPPPIFVVRLELTGPRTVAPGATAQYSATEVLSDGTSRTPTAVAWNTNNAAILSITSTGLATGNTVGDASVRATSGGRSATIAVVVVPTGTYRLVGLVGEADSPSTPIPDARVEAIGGSNPSAQTNSFGHYRLYGVAADAQIRITKTGYQPLTQNVTLADHHVQNFVLSVSAPRIDLSGTYTLTISASDQCRTNLAADARTRTYRATLTQQGPIVQAVLSEATFSVRSGRGDRFGGRLEPSRVVFSVATADFYYYYYDEPAIVEQITPSLYLTVTGSTALALTPPRLSGALDGIVSTYQRDPQTSAPGPPTGTCRSNDHRFELAR